MKRRTTHNLLFMHDDREMLLELSLALPRKATHFSPPEDAGMEITSACFPTGELLNDDEIKHLISRHFDEIFEQATKEIDDYNEYMRSLNYDERV